MVRPYRGVSAAERRDERRARLLEAAFGAVAADGVAGTTVGLVCARAGLSKRYFYESFTDLDDLLTTALDTVFDGVRDAIATALTGAGSDPLERATRTVDALVTTLAADAGAARLYAEAPGLPVLRERRDAAVDRFAALLLDTVFGIGRPDTRQRLAALVVVAGTTEAVSRWLAGSRRRPSRATLVGEIAEIGAAVAATLR